MKTTLLIAAAASCFAQAAVAGPLGEHPAVLVKRNAGVESVQAQTMKFYMHPAGLRLLAHAPSDAGTEVPSDSPSRLAVAQHAKAGTAN